MLNDMSLYCLAKQTPPKNIGSYPRICRPCLQSWLPLLTEQWSCRVPPGHGNQLCRTVGKRTVRRDVRGSPDTRRRRHPRYSTGNACIPFRRRLREKSKCLMLVVWYGVINTKVGRSGVGSQNYVKA